MPERLPFREKEVGALTRLLSPALQGEKPRNAFIYGITGTGKTCVARRVMERFRGKEKSEALYINCRVFSTKYKVFQQIGRAVVPGLDKIGFGFSFIYEQLVKTISRRGLQVIAVLDEIDTVKDLDALVYSLVRINDELPSGGLTIVGISNRLLLKASLDPRTKSSLFEKEFVFKPYDAEQLSTILNERVPLAFHEGVVSEGAVSLAAAIAAQEGGDARHAISLLRIAGEIAEEKGDPKVEEEHVEEARKSAEEDAVREVISTLPLHQKLLLMAIARKSKERGKALDGSRMLITGMAYEEYVRLCQGLGKRPRTSRWIRDYLSEFARLGLISLHETGRGMRGQSQVITLLYDPEVLLRLLEGSL